MPLPGGPYDVFQSGNLGFQPSSVNAFPLKPPVSAGRPAAAVFRAPAISFR